MRMRRGFTLIEVLIAVALIDAALFALVAASLAVIRRTAELRTRTTAVQLAADRLQLLSAAPCLEHSDNTHHQGGIREFWSVTAIDARSIELTDSVEFDIQGRTHVTVLRTRRLC